VGVPPGLGDHSSQAIILHPTLHSAVEIYMACVGRDQGALYGGTALQAHTGEDIQQGDGEG